MAVVWSHDLNGPTSIEKNIEKNWDWVVDRHNRIAYDGEKQVLRGC